ncbi:MAG TPA: hypothetical protein VN158_14710 [Caulobacter sp.]|nr:hypothetical protein [Caulobacter sp.]
MTLASKSPTPLGSNRAARALVLAVVGAPLGYLVGKSLARLEDAGVWTAPDLGWSDVLALFLALLLLGVGAITMIVSASRRTLGRRIDPEGGRPATSVQALFYARNGGVLALAGLMLAAPVIVRAVLDPVPPLIASATMIGLLALFLVQIASNITVWIQSDELMRRATAEISAVTFVILLGALFLWAAGEKLGLLPVLTLWDAATVMMTAYLAIAGVVIWRRGLAS